MKIGKPTVLTVAVVALLCVVAVETIIIWWFNVTYNPFVVTDSYNKRFDPKKFQFGHYSHIARNEHQFNPALLKMFPLGTDKSYVDQILVKQALATITKNQNSPRHQPGESDYTYIYGTWLVNFVFDDNNKSVAMITNPNKPLYGINRYLQGRRPWEKREPNNRPDDGVSNE